MIDEAGALRAIHQRHNRPLVSFIETWQDIAAVPDATDWTATDPATGAAWSLGASWWTLEATSAPNADEVCRLVSTIRWPMGPGTWTDGTILRKFFLEFVMKLSTVANIDNSISWFGLSESAAATRLTNNLIGFALTGDAVQSVTDSAASETTNTGFGETVSNWNRFGLEVRYGAIDFLLNGVVVATHTTNLPSVPMYLNYYVDTEGGGAATIELGTIRMWYEDSIRY